MRLTKRIGKAVFIFSKATAWTRSSNWSEPAENAIQRLAQYEDTGLEPEHIEAQQQTIQQLQVQVKNYKYALQTAMDTLNMFVTNKPMENAKMEIREALAILKAGEP